MSFRRLGPLALLAWLALLASAVPAASAAEATPQAATRGAGPGSLHARLDAKLAVPALRGAQIAALVVARDDGRELYARDADRALVPASNQKVLTALAALSRFGPAYRFLTRVQADALPDAQGGVQRLYVRGGGDPVMTSEQWWRLAADLRARGLHRVRGDLVLDDSHFDGERWHPDWGGSSMRAYQAPVGALSANYSAYEVWVEPGAAAGAPLRVHVDPPVDYLRIVNRGQTVARGGKARLAVDREPGGDFERVVVSGTLPVGRDRRRFARSVLDPTRYAGSVLRMQLEAVGITIGGATRIAPAPPGASVLLDFEGLPLGEIVQRFMKWSNNAIGETLLKELGADAQGAPGSWPKGAFAMRAQLSGLDLDVGALALADGSGLANTNRTTPRLLVQALRTARDSFRFGPEFVTSLPIAGVDGTLHQRANAARGAVRAKTGLLNQVSGLSGFAQCASGEDAVFSLLVNGFRTDARSVMRAVDGFVAELVVSAPAPPR